MLRQRAVDGEQQGIASPEAYLESDQLSSARARNFFLLLSLLIAGLLSSATAQSLHIVAILSETGEHADVGKRQANTLLMLELDTRAQGGIAGMAVDIDMLDDQSKPELALELALGLPADTHIVLCCSAAESALAVSEAGLELPLLVLQPEVPSSYWYFGLAAEPQDTDQLLLASLPQHFQSIAVMAAMAYAVDLEERLAEAGITPVALLTYPADATVLTPEALWIATREPAMVLLWGEAVDSQLALHALRQRGYEGPVAIRPEQVEGLANLDAQSFTVLSTKALGPELANPAREQFYAQHQETFGASYLHAHDVEAAFGVWDAFQLMRLGVEQSLGYGLDVSHVAVFRQAIRDAIIALPPFEGVLARYDFSEGKQQLAAEDYALAVYRDGWQLWQP